MQRILFLTLLGIMFVGCDKSEPGAGKEGGVRSEDKTVSDGVPAPDNSAVNERDRAPDAKTAGAQGQGKTDVQLTADIRKQVVKTDMSTNAHNSKIVTQNGKVTLRGPVKTQKEKDIIGRIAIEVAGADNVDNQLEVEDNAAYQNNATQPVGPS